MGRAKKCTTNTSRKKLETGNSYKSPDPKLTLLNEKFRKKLPELKFIDTEGRVPSSDQKTGLKYLTVMDQMRQEYEKKSHEQERKRRDQYIRPNRSSTPASDLLDNNTWYDKLFIDLLKEMNMSHYIDEVLTGDLTLGNDGLTGIYKELLKFAVPNRFDDMYAEYRQF